MLFTEICPSLHTLAPPGGLHPSALGIQIVSTHRTVELYETSHYRYVRSLPALSNFSFICQSFARSPPLSAHLLLIGGARKRRVHCPSIAVRHTVYRCRDYHVILRLVGGQHIISAGRRSRRSRRSGCTTWSSTWRTRCSATRAAASMRTTSSCSCSSSRSRRTSRPGTSSTRSSRSSSKVSGSVFADQGRDQSTEFWWQHAQQRSTPAVICLGAPTRTCYSRLIHSVRHKSKFYRNDFEDRAVVWHRGFFDLSYTVFEGNLVM